MNNKILFAFSLSCFAGAWASDTTIAYGGGRKYGTFVMDGRSNITSTARTDVPDTVRFANGLTLTRVVSQGGSCILGCSYPVQTAIAFHADSGSIGFGNDTVVGWNEAVDFPPSLKPLDSIGSMALSPCYGGGPYGVGLFVSSDDASSLGSACADISTFRALAGNDRIIFHRQGNVFVKIQVAGFEIDPTDCVAGHPLYKCSRGDKIVFRYVITDDSRGHFGTDVISLKPRTSPSKAAGTGMKVWKTNLYWLVLGRRIDTPASR